MKTKIIVMVLLVLLTFAACTPPATSPTNSVSLFFQFTPCGPTPMYVFDTASGKLVYTPLGGTTSKTITLRLTDDELETVYQRALSIGFFDYPSHFVVPNDQSLGNVTPAASYEISMSDGTLTNSVSWTDEARTKPGYTKADQLRELMMVIYKTIQSHPEVQKLPGGAACR